MSINLVSLEQSKCLQLEMVKDFKRLYGMEYGIHDNYRFARDATDKTENSSLKRKKKA
jgi:hypothetical protein